MAVTGASGFIGGAFLEQLARERHNVVALVRRPTALQGATVRVVGDLENAKGLAEALKGVDVLIHLAARAHVMREQSFGTLPLYRAVNVEGTRRLAAAAVAAGVRRIVFVSSIKVNGERTAARPFTAGDEPAPQDAYGVSKREAEAALWRIAGETDLEVTVIRPPLVYGPSVKGNMRRLASLVQRGLPLPFGAVRNRRSFVSVYNLCDLLVRCIEHPAAAGQIFLASDGEDLSTPGLIREMAAALSRPVRLWPVPVPVLRLMGRLTGSLDEIDRLCDSLQMDIAKTRELLGWHPPLSIREGFRRAMSASTPSS
ncbi:MAG TPA: NAD-dependent epimerase/dehydratase family protein [Nitrococcus sp.]|nr:NAD-dependent epimerase/dehydratase family protein [Nitrococcus sp.]